MNLIIYSEFIIEGEDGSQHQIYKARTASPINGTTVKAILDVHNEKVAAIERKISK